MNNMWVMLPPEKKSTASAPCAKGPTYVPGKWYRSPMPFVDGKGPELSGDAKVFQEKVFQALLDGPAQKDMRKCTGPDGAAIGSVHQFKTDCPAMAKDPVPGKPSHQELWVKYKESPSVDKATGVPGALMGVCAEDPDVACRCPSEDGADCTAAGGLSREQCGAVHPEGADRPEGADGGGRLQLEFEQTASGLALVGLWDSSPLDPSIGDLLLPMHESDEEDPPPPMMGGSIKQHRRLSDAAPKSRNLLCWPWNLPIPLSIQSAPQGVSEGGSVASSRSDAGSDWSLVGSEGADTEGSVTGSGKGSEKGSGKGSGKGTGKGIEGLGEHWDESTVAKYIQQTSGGGGEQPAECHVVKVENLSFKMDPVEEYEFDLNLRKSRFASKAHVHLKEEDDKDTIVLLLDGFPPDMAMNFVSSSSDFLESKRTFWDEFVMMHAFGALTPDLANQSMARGVDYLSFYGAIGVLLAPAMDVLDAKGGQDKEFTKSLRKLNAINHHVRGDSVPISEIFKESVVPSTEDLLDPPARTR